MNDSAYITEAINWSCTGVCVGIAVGYIIGKTEATVRSLRKWRNHEHH